MRRSRIVLWVQMVLVCAVVVSCKFECGSGGIGFQIDKSGEALKAHQEGLELLGANKPEQAAQRFRRASQLAPDKPQPRVGLCQAESMTGDLQRAGWACEEAAKADPKNPEVHYQLGSIHLRDGQLARARAALDTALALQPDNGPALAMLGVVHMQEKQWDKAIEALKKASALSPDNRSLHHNLAIALINAGRCEQAKAVAERAERLGDDLKDIRQAQQRHCSVPEPPEGMVGAEEDRRVFFIDQRAVWGMEYSDCVDAGKCPRPSYDEFNRKGDGRRQPAMSVTWPGAGAYCSWKGKRLPTLAEYEASWQQLTFRGCCVRGVIPREWTSDQGARKGTAVQVRKRGAELHKLDERKSRGRDSTTVRCAMDP